LLVEVNSLVAVEALAVEAFHPVTALELKPMKLHSIHWY
jgi:hypothetical protein